MGKIATILREGEWPHTADLYAMWFGAIGSGYIMPVEMECKPTLPSQTEVKIESGKVSFGASGNAVYDGDVFAPEIGSEFPRLDFLYLKAVISDGQLYATPEVIKGSEFKIPSVSMPPTEKIVPIAIIYWDENQVIKELRDVRVVVDPEHSHTAGKGLTLDESNAEMKVNADEDTITVQDGVVEINNIQISPDKLHEGLELRNGREMDVDTGVGIGIDQVTDSDGNVTRELLVLEPTELAGGGLTVKDGSLGVEIGNGLDLVSDRVTVDTGEGVILRGTTPDRQIDLYHQEYGGLYFENERAIIQAKDLAGSGINGVNEELNVEAGDEISVGTAVDIDAGRGISAGTALNVDRATNGGIKVDANDQLYAEAEGMGGDGLSMSAGVLNVNAGNGIYTVSDKVHMDTGDGLKVNNGLVEADGGTGIGVGSTYGRLVAAPDEIAGVGLQGISGDLAMDVDGGLEIVSDQVDANTTNCVTTDNGELKVVPSALVDGDTLTVSNENIYLNDKPKFFELLADETFTLSPGEEHVITVADVMPLVSINAVGQPSTNHGEYEWYWQEHSDETGGKQEIVIEYPSGNYSDDINLRARIYHIKWETWME